jgi:predicted site-specific integrase-resolvase
MNICEKEAARTIGLSVQTLRNWRHLGKGPAYVKLGRSVRYRIDDLMDFIDKHRIDPEKDGVQ